MQSLLENNTGSLLSSLQEAGVNATGIFVAPEDTAPVTSLTAVVSATVPVPGGQPPDATIAAVQGALSPNGAVVLALARAGFVGEASGVQLAFTPPAVVSTTPPMPPPPLPPFPSPLPRPLPLPPFPPPLPPPPLCPLSVSVSPSFSGGSVDRGQDVFLYSQASPNPRLLSGILGGAVLPGNFNPNSVSSCSINGASLPLDPSH